MSKSIQNIFTIAVSDETKNRIVKVNEDSKKMSWQKANISCTIRFLLELGIKEYFRIYGEHLENEDKGT